MRTANHLAQASCTKLTLRREKLKYNLSGKPIANIQIGTTFLLNFLNLKTGNDARARFKIFLQIIKGLSCELFFHIYITALKKQPIFSALGTYCIQLPPKRQLISKYPFGVFKQTKKPTKFLKEFPPQPLIGGKLKSALDTTHSLRRDLNKRFLPRAKTTTA